MTEPDFSTTIFQLRAAQAGDQQVLDDLLRRYLPRIRKAVARHLDTGPHQAAQVDDAVQDVLLAAFRGIGTYRPRNDATFMSWLAKLVANKVCDRLRRASRQKRDGGKLRSLGDLASESSGEPNVVSLDPSVSQTVRVRELEDAEQRALAMLSPAHRAVIVDRVKLGLTFEEIASKCGYDSAEPPRALFRRAQRKLRALMRRFDELGGAAEPAGGA